MRIILFIMLLVPALGVCQLPSKSDLPVYQINMDGDTLFITTRDEFRDLVFARHLSIDLMEQDSLNRVAVIRAEVYIDQLWSVIRQRNETINRQDTVILKVKEQRNKYQEENNVLRVDLEVVEKKKNGWKWFSLGSFAALLISLLRGG